MSKRITNDILRGRPFGGIAITWRMSAVSNINIYLVSCNSRCLTISFESEQCIYFVINLYLPCSANYTNEQEVEMIKCMSFNEDFVISQSSDKDVKVVLCGDFNACVDMINSNAH